MVRAVEFSVAAVLWAWMAFFTKPGTCVHCLSSLFVLLLQCGNIMACSLLGFHSFLNQENLAVSQVLSWVVSSQRPDLLNGLKLSPDTQLVLLPAPTQWPDGLLQQGAGE